MSTIYISEFSKENIKIGEELKKIDNKTFCLLWKNKDSEKSKEDFESLMGNCYLNNFYIINEQPNNLKFAEAIFSFIKLRAKYPDRVIVRGLLQEIWPLAVMKSIVFIQSQ